MDIRTDIVKMANAKLAKMEKEGGITDQIRGMYDSIVGTNGSLSSGAYGLGGMGLGAAAGSHFGTPGMIAGGALGGMMGYGGANAINQQGNMQNTMDSAMIGGMGSGLMTNDIVDQQQSQALDQQGQMIGQIMSYLTAGQQPSGMSQDMGMDMGGAQYPGMEDPSGMGMEQGSMASTDPSMNGLGKGNTKKSSVNDDVIDELAEKVASKLLGR